MQDTENGVDREIGSGQLKHQVADTMRQRIDAGTYRPGDKLPSIRELSRALQVSVTTVKGAYAILEIDGYVVVHQQSGIYVRLRSPLVKSSQRTNPPATPVMMTLQENLDGTISSSVQVRKRLLSAGSPNDDQLPTRGINAAIKRVALQAGNIHIRYSESRGLQELREQIAQNSMLKGCVLDPDQIVVTNGCTEALVLALQTVVQPGEIVAVESPAYPGLLNAMKSQGLRILEVPSFPDDGIDVEALEALVTQFPIAAVFVTPNFCNPTGARIPIASRQRMVKMLGERDIPLIEDDIYGDLTFDLRPIPTCKAFDEKGLVLLCSSFSKTLSPGLRVGWIAGGRFDGQLLARKSASTVCTGALSQMIVSEFLREHRFSRVIAKASTAYGKNMHSLTACVRRTFPSGTVVAPPAGGFLLWVQMPVNFSSKRLLELSTKEGIIFVPGFKYSAHAMYGNCLRISATYWDKDVEAQVTRLGELAASAQM